jgi:hypothetical protein
MNVDCIVETCRNIAPIEIEWNPNLTSMHTRFIDLCILLCIVLLCAVPTLSSAAASGNEVNQGGAYSNTGSSASPSTSAYSSKTDQSKREKRAKRAQSRISSVGTKINEELKKSRLSRSKRIQSELTKQRAKAEKTGGNDNKSQKSNQNQAAAPELREKGIEKIKFLDKETSRSSNKIINIDSAGYNNYILDGYRPYYVYLVYTALTSANNCPLCKDADRAASYVAQAHYELRKKQLLEQKHDVDQDLPVYFINVDVAKHGKHRHTIEPSKDQSTPPCSL